MKYLLNRMISRDLKLDMDGRTVETLMEFAKESVVCVGEAHVFQIDYKFISQVGASYKILKCNLNSH